jgi:hypothetical protein
MKKLCIHAQDYDSWKVVNVLLLHIIHHLQVIYYDPSITGFLGCPYLLEEWSDYIDTHIIRNYRSRQS